MKEPESINRENSHKYRCKMERDETQKGTLTGEAFKKIARTLCRTFSVRYSFIYFINDSHQLDTYHYSTLEETVCTQPRPNLKALFLHLMEKRQPVVIKNRATTSCFKENLFSTEHEFCFFAAAPVRPAGSKGLTAAVMIADDDSRPFSDRDLSLLVDLSAWAEAEIKLALNAGEEQYNPEEELLAAGTIQKSLLPPPIHTRELKLKTIYEPHQFISGDSFGFDYNTEERKLSLYILDVMGHGLPAAIQTNSLKLIFDQVLKETGSLPEKLKKINEHAITVLSRDYFAAALLAELDTETGQLIYSAAGINKFIISKEGIPEIIKISGPLLGLFRNEIYDTGATVLNPSDHVHFVTDGLMDHLNEDKLKQCRSFEQLHMLLYHTANKGRMADDASALSISLPKLS